MGGGGDDSERRILTLAFPDPNKKIGGRVSQ
jgi:hypothetical protein